MYGDTKTETGIGARDSERVGDWCCTASGWRVWPHDPRPEDVNLEDIARHLSNISRYNGAARRFYSVAEHSVLVSQEVEARDGDAIAQWWGLMHDAHEFILGDPTRPFKRHPSFAYFRELADRWDRAIAERFNMPYPMPEIVGVADNAVMHLEAVEYEIMPCDGPGGTRHWHWPEGCESVSGKAVWCLASNTAYREFLQRWERVCERLL